MSRRMVAALALAAGLLVPTISEARFSIGAGDLIWSDGQTFTYEEYQEYKKTHPADAPAPPPQQQPQYQYQAQPQYQYQQYQSQYQPQYQAAPAYAPTTSSGTLVGGQPVVQIAPPGVAAPLPMAPGSNVASLPPQYAVAPVVLIPPGTASAAAPALRAASCKTTKFYDEFPADTERFDCGQLGQLTRQDMLAQGWKVDFIDKVPATPGQPLPNAYKIILSR